MKSKLEIYALAVCFSSVIFIVLFSSMAGYGLFEIFSPEITMGSYNYDKYQSNDQYWKERSYSSCDEDEKKKKERPAEDLLTKQRLEAFNVALKAETREGRQACLKALVYIFVSSIALAIHWRIAKKSRTS